MLWYDIRLDRVAMNFGRKAIPDVGRIVWRYQQMTLRRIQVLREILSVQVPVKLDDAQLSSELTLGSVNSRNVEIIDDGRRAVLLEQGVQSVRKTVFRPKLNTANELISRA
jgi:hypothetical protein